jgi:hypothetical protein
MRSYGFKPDIIYLYALLFLAGVWQPSFVCLIINWHHATCPVNTVAQPGSAEIGSKLT